MAMARERVAGSLKGGRTHVHGAYAKVRTSKGRKAVAGRFGAVKVVEAELRPLGLSYGVLVTRLKDAGVEPDPVRLAHLAQEDRPQFLKVVRLASGPIKKKMAAKSKGRDDKKVPAVEVRVRNPRVSVPELIARMRAVIVAGVVGDTVSAGEADAMVEAVSDRLPDFADPTQTLGPYYDTGGLRRRLGVKRQALDGRRRRNTLLAVEADDGSMLYPTWQFTKDFGVVGGLPAVLKELDKVAEDGFSKAVWLTTPQDEFDGRSAVEWLARSGDPERVRAVAQADVERLLR